MKVKSYKELIVWKKSMELVLTIYKLTQSFPSHELYGLTSQIRRAVVSIPSNIAEGSMRSTRKDYRHFLLCAFGSGAELETQVEIAKKLSYGNFDEYTNIDQLLEEVMKMLNVLTEKLNEESNH